VAGEALKFDLRTEPDTKVLSFALSRFAEYVDDMTTLFEAFDPLFRGAMQKQFASEGGYGSGGWAALSPAYAAWKAEHFPGRPIGVLRGHLRSAMTGGSGYSSEIEPHRASYGLAGGPAAEYGQYFDQGGRGPARPVVRMPSSEGRTWGKVAHSWLYDQAVLAGWGSY